jgi:hypothetical protein
LNPKTEALQPAAAPALAIDPLEDKGDAIQIEFEPAEATAPLNDDEHFARRAQATIQTLSDNTGRQLVAEILEVKADSLKIRRQSDRRILQLPVAMLSPGDKAFAAYLWEQHKPKETNAASSMEDMIWDELFK